MFVSSYLRSTKTFSKHAIPDSIHWRLHDESKVFANCDLSITLHNKRNAYTISSGTHKILVEYDSPIFLDVQKLYNIK